MDKKQLVLVLAHGSFGWGADQDKDQKRDYFYGVKNFLDAEYGSRSDLQLAVIAPNVPAVDSVEERGAALKQQIDAELGKWPPKTRVHILGHSMGGLDARWVIVQEGMADKIASLTTIATPHRGTTLGNWAYKESGVATLAVKGLFRLDELRELFRRSLFSLEKTKSDELEFYHHLLRNFESASKAQIDKCLYALTLEGAARFNDAHASLEAAVRARTQNRVAYFAYGGRMMPGQTDLLKPANEIIQHFGTDEEKNHTGSDDETCNDGAVSIWSAHFPWDDSGEDYIGTNPFDHFMHINWRIPDERPNDELEDNLKTVYRQIVENILRVQQKQQSELVA